MPFLNAVLSQLKKNLTGLKHLLGITKDPGLPEALRARMFALEDEVNMVMGQYLSAV